MNLKKIVKAGIRGGIINSLTQFTSITLLGIFGLIDQNKLGDAPIINLPNTVVICIVVPIIEELLFRGPLRLLLFWKKCPPWTKYAMFFLTSVMFGYLHIYNYSDPFSVDAAAYAFIKVVSGFVLGWTVIESSSLLASMINHSFLNSTVVTMLTIQKIIK